MDKNEILRQALIKTFMKHDPDGVYEDEDNRANGLQPLDLDSGRKLCVKWGKEQIENDVQAGVVPRTVADFSALHDYVDANYYGLMFDLWEFCQCDEPMDVLIPFTNLVQDDLAAWIKSGALRGESIR